MVAHVRAVFLGLVLTLVAVVASDESQQPVDAQQSADGSDQAAIRSERDVAEIGKGRLLGQVSTTTLWSISVSTSTQFYSCLSGGVATPACGGKRKKRRITNMENIEDNVNPRILGSIDEDVQELDLKKSEKLYGFTVWTAVTASSTVVVFTTDTASTVRVSYYCTAALLDTNLAACGG